MWVLAEFFEFEFIYLNLYDPVKFMEYFNHNFLKQAKIKVFTLISLTVIFRQKKYIIIYQKEENYV